MTEIASGSTTLNAGKPGNQPAISPKEFIFKYLHYLPLVVLSVAVFLAMAYIKIRYSTEIYRVQSSMLINNNQDNTPSKDARFEELFLAQGSANLSNEIEILKSRPVLQRVARDLNLQVRYVTKGNLKSGLLYKNSPLILDLVKLTDTVNGVFCKVTIVDDTRFQINDDKKVYAFGQLITMPGATFRIEKVPTVDIRSYASMIFEVSWLPLPAAAEGLIGSLKIAQLNEQATILTLSFEGENANLGKDVLNTLMAVYDTLTIEDKNKMQSNTLRFINDRLLELNDTLKGVQGGLRSFMIENRVFDLETQSKNYLDRLGESAKQRNEIDVKIGIVNFLIQYISDSKNLHELVPTNLGIEEPALSQLVTEYNHLQLERENNLRTAAPNNPLILTLDGSLDKIRREIAQALLNVKQAYTIASNNLEKRDQELEGQITSLPGRSMQLVNKERQQKILEDLYSLLLQKKLDISLSSASTISNSRVVESAIGYGAPIAPDHKKIYTFYLLLGLLIPIGAVAARELLKDKVNGRADVEKNTNAPILGEIGHSEGENSLVVTNNSRRLISEQFRIIRTNLQYIIGKSEKPVIMVTSSFSGEGKSFISTNIGSVMALSGKKTVIMEFDIRKPKIISGLDLKRKMGITNYIIGKASFEELLIKVESVEGLYVIPCGPIPPNPAELLLDKRLDELMSEVIAHFDVVVMDTAPIGLVSDAANLSRFADCSLYVVREGYTFRNQLAFVEELYSTQKLPNLCIVINDTKAQGGYYGRYYGRAYGYYGGYNYGAGYFEENTKKKKKGFFSWIGGLRKKLFG